ncbi:DUF7218 family protein [Sphingobacterium paludis]|uniref:Rho termination factor-like protein n=1 Tax=Sphingobacterium paludis TaxID=1476465 RepID=A0A4R7CZE4_9SPHI|nr:Rho termination factor N-terminal domain-containing protein [Sphingobacterium paludis]TDS13131.1 Rho termination factor-like protein [Sphingobacterium paludis]
MAKNTNPRIKNEAQYAALREQGASKEKAARIANSKNASKKGGHASTLEKRTVKELLEEAKNIGITNRHSMKKQDLIHAIRNH